MDDKIHSFSLLGRERERVNYLSIWRNRGASNEVWASLYFKIKKKVYFFLIFQP
jgi:hypothetical protein